MYDQWSQLSAEMGAQMGRPALQRYKGAGGGLQSLNAMRWQHTGPAA